jgi:putative Mn2+ efflux pump MntP
MGKRDERALVGLFGLCDGTATLLGAIFSVAWLRSVPPMPEWFGAALVFAYGLFVLLAARLGRTFDPARRRWAAYILPPLLSLDNLIAGLHTTPAWGSLVSFAVFCGLTSALFAAVGMRLGRSVAGRVTVPSAPFSAAAFAAAGMAMLVLDQLS